MKVDGKCLCGAVSYEAEVDTSKIVICHCTDCQTNSGTAYGVVAVVVDGTFKLLTGELRTFVKVADSGNRRRLEFCPTCGTRIVAKPAEGEEGFVSLRIGTATQRDQLAPIAQLWSRSARSWVQDLSELPSFETVPGAKT